MSGELTNFNRRMELLQTITNHIAMYDGISSYMVGRNTATYSSRTPQVMKSMASVYKGISLAKIEMSQDIEDFIHGFLEYSENWEVINLIAHKNQLLTRRECVRNGIAVLDKMLPEWKSRVDLDTLCMHDPGNCILGQVFVVYSTGIWEIRKYFNLPKKETDPGFDPNLVFKMGFSVNTADVRDFEALTEVWKEEIRKELENAKENSGTDLPEQHQRQDDSKGSGDQG